MNKFTTVTFKDRLLFFSLLGVVLVMLAVTGVSLIYFMRQIDRAQIQEENSAENQYQYHYAFITGNTQEAFYQSVYEGAREKGETEGIFVEYMGKNLAIKYTAAELARIAVAADVDGIIVEAGESEEMIAVINEAVEGEKDIPVVTVGNDCTGSARQSFVGISYFELGQLYGEQVLRLTTEESAQGSPEEMPGEHNTSAEPPDGSPRVLILMKTGYENSSQNIIYSGIREILRDSCQIETAAVNDEFSFSAEESIRDIIMTSERLPDILICLDELTTTCVYQAVVDYNKVGNMEIIGYYDSDLILDTIEKNILQATVAVDARQMGEYCVTALTEYANTGYVSEYFPVDMTVITTDNVREYRTDEEN